MVKYYKIVNTKSYHNHKFGSIARDYTIHFENLSNFVAPNENNVYSILLNCFDQLFRELVSDFGATGLVRIVFNCSGIDRPVSIPFLGTDQVSAHTFFEAVEAVLQSHKVIDLSEDDVVINVIHVELPVVGGYKRKNFLVEKWLTKARTIITCTPSEDDLCLSKCLAIAIADLDGSNDYKTLMRIRNNIPKHTNKLILLAQQLHTSASVELGQKCNINDVAKFDDYLSTTKRMTIQVINVSGDMMYRIQERINTHKVISLLFHNNHTYYIKSMTALMNQKLYCLQCHIWYSHFFEHRTCPDRCLLCCMEQCPNRTIERVIVFECSECNFSFFNETCYEAHKISTCDLFVKCFQCHRRIKRKKVEHHLENECQKIICTRCGEKYKPSLVSEHMCFVRPLAMEMYKHDPAIDRNQMIWFDFETIFEKDGHHTVNLVCCMGEDDSDIHTFFGKDTCLKDFLSYVFDLADSNPSIMYSLVAHNLGHFDGILLLASLHQQGLKAKSIVYRQSKILLLELRQNLRAVDSLNYLSVPLSALSDMFDLPASKLSFPFFGNTEEFLKGETDYPLLADFNINRLPRKRREAFVIQYEKEKAEFLAAGKPYVYKDELIRYCIEDCRVLKQATLAFTKIYLESTNIRPMVWRFTLPGDLLLFYRCKFLMKESLIIIGSDGLACRRQTSKIAQQWLSYQSYIRQVNIKTKDTMGEVRFRNKYYLDGYCEITKETGLHRIAFSMHGCFYHAHDCIPRLRQGTHPLYNIPNEQVRRRDHFLSEALADSNIEHVLIYECQFRQQVKDDIRIQQFFENNGERIWNHVDIKASFMGGRVDCCILKTICDTKKASVKNYDFISSYGKCLKMAYPVGKPKVIAGYLIEKPYSIDDYFGIIRCRVLPPKRLYLPVLGIKHNNKLMFALCGSCMMEDAQTYCNHDDKDRLIDGSWTTIELKMAVKMGYVIESIDEVYHWQDSSTDLFGSYVDLFFLIKTLASGYPTDVQTESEKEKYINELEKDCGLKINRSEIRYSNPRRLLSKILILSLWGRCASVQVNTTTRYISRLEEFYRVFRDKNIHVQDMIFVSDDTVMLTLKDISEPYAVGPTSSLIVGTWTTALGRTQLLELCLQVGEDKILTMDTDGLYAVIPNGCDPEFHEPLTTKKVLGGVCAEFESKVSRSAICDRFICVAPKNYAYHIYDPMKISDGKMWEDTVFHVRGISFNFYAEQVINFENMEKLLADSSIEFKVLNPNKIVRDGKGKGIRNKTEERVYRFRFTKRLVDFDDPILRTYPLGWTL